MKNKGVVIKVSLCCVVAVMLVIGGIPIKKYINEQNLIKSMELTSDEEKLALNNVRELNGFYNKFNGCDIELEDVFVVHYDNDEAYMKSDVTFITFISPNTGFKCVASYDDYDFVTMFKDEYEYCTDEYDYSKLSIEEIEDLDNELICDAAYLSATSDEEDTSELNDFKVTHIDIKKLSYNLNKDN